MQTVTVNKHKIVVLILGVVFAASAGMHDFYLSTTMVKWVPEKSEIQLTSRFFIDDLESLMQKTNPEIVFAPDAQPDEIGRFIEHFFVTNVQLALDGQRQNIDFLGREYQDDLLVVYAQIENVPSRWFSLEIKNTFLIDFLEKQQNIVHIQTPIKKKSFLLTKNRKELKFMHELN